MAHGMAMARTSLSLQAKLYLPQSRVDGQLATPSIRTSILKPGHPGTKKLNKPSPIYFECPSLFYQKEPDGTQRLGCREMDAIVFPARKRCSRITAAPGAPR